jgi:hypothetical protein
LQNTDINLRAFVFVDQYKGDRGGNGNDHE